MEKLMDKTQQRVIDAIQPYNLVLAPPGCGKTEILTHRIMKAHERGVPFREMLCLTFTNRASRGMLDRIRQNIKDPEVAEMHVGNVHHFCSQFLFKNAIVPDNTSIVDELDVEDIMNECGMKKLRVSDYEKPKLQSAISAQAACLYQREFKHPENVFLYSPEDCILEDHPDYTEAIRNIAQAYYDYKKMHCLMDFNDILLETYTAMMSPTYKEDYEDADFRWIQVDEVQDLNPMQFAIIEKITSRKDPVVMYLGDEQQAIFSFMGAKMSSLGELRRKAGGRVLRLERNYRSPKYLLDVLNCFAEDELGIDEEMLPKTDNDIPKPAGALKIVSSSNDRYELVDIAEHAKRFIELYPEDRTAIIVRSNKSAELVSEALTRINLEHFKLSGKDTFKSDSYKALVAHMTVVAKDNAYMEWARLLNATKSTDSFTTARSVVRRLREVALSPSDFFNHPGSSYLQDFYASYRDKEIVIFDTETTGLNVFEDDIIQIAAVKVRGGQVVPGSEYDIILETDKEIPAMLGTKVNPMVAVYNERERMSRAEGLEDFLRYIGDDEVLGHNSTYDLEILRNNVLRVFPGRDVHDSVKRCWDSLKLIRLIQPYFRGYRLEALLKLLGLEGVNSHKANDDILATKSLVDYCFGRCPEKISEQKALMRDSFVKEVMDCFVQRYKPLYEHTVGLLDSAAAEGDRPLVVSEMEWFYKIMAGQFDLALHPRMHYAFDFLSEHIKAAGKDPHLRSQLMNHVIELTTFSEADLCESDIVKEKIYVMTVHKAKGLEFETVIVQGAVDSTYPFLRCSTPDEVDEDKRVFYVAISRAKKRLYISFYHNSRGRTKYRTPFLDSILHYFK